MVDRSYSVIAAELEVCIQIPLTTSALEEVHKLSRGHVVRVEQLHKLKRANKKPMEKRRKEKTARTLSRVCSAILKAKRTMKGPETKGKINKGGSRTLMKNELNRKYAAS